RSAAIITHPQVQVLRARLDGVAPALVEGVGEVIAHAVVFLALDLRVLRLSSTQQARELDDWPVEPIETRVRILSKQHRRIAVAVVAHLDLVEGPITERLRQRPLQLVHLAGPATNARR